MTKYYIAALAIATALNIFYTVYSYNEVNKWKQDMSEWKQSQELKWKQDMSEWKQSQELQYDLDLEKLQEEIKAMQSQVNTKIDSKLVDQINSRMLETMMSLEARVYELELKDIEQKLRESVDK
jgi:predicted PurR-regulated permease PerM